MKKITIYCFMIICLFACKRTDEYYGTLVKQPELIKDYRPVYSVGDTIHMRGRLDPGSLKITIGDAEAQIVNIQADTSVAQWQHVDVLVTKAMGIGTNRPVAITSSGIRITGPSIEIVEDAQSGILPRELTLEQVAAHPGTNTRSIYCRNRSGNMYYIRTRNLAINRMDKEGRTQEVFNTDMGKDANGNPLVFTAINAAGIDPSETWLYLSVYTEATSGEDFHYYRLCRFNLRTGAFTVLNKTPYHKNDPTKQTLSDLAPFEGNIASVKMFAASAIYPDSNGNVIFNMGYWAITKLDTEGRYSFRCKNSDNYRFTPDGFPPVYDPGSRSYLNSFSKMALLPGISFNFTGLEALDPEHEQLYLHRFMSGVQQSLAIYDLKVSTQTGILDRHLQYSERPVYISGSFAVLSGFASTPNTFFGLTPTGDGQALLLYYQDHYYKNNPAIQMPAWGILDFVAKRGSRYAPGRFDAKEYVMNRETDEVLCIDDEGHIYMTANNKKFIVKTVYK